MIFHSPKSNFNDCEPPTRGGPSAIRNNTRILHQNETASFKSKVDSVSSSESFRDGYFLAEITVGPSIRDIQNFVT